MKRPSESCMEVFILQRFLRLPEDKQNAYVDRLRLFFCDLTLHCDCRECIAELCQECGG